MKTPLTPLDLVRRGLKLYPNNVAVIEPHGPEDVRREIAAGRHPPDTLIGGACSIS